MGVNLAILAIAAGTMSQEWIVDEYENHANNVLTAGTYYGTVWSTFIYDIPLLSLDFDSSKFEMLEEALVAYSAILKHHREFETFTIAHSDSLSAERVEYSQKQISLIMKELYQSIEESALSAINKHNLPWSLEALQHELSHPWDASPTRKLPSQAINIRGRVFTGIVLLAVTSILFNPNRLRNFQQWLRCLRF